jgi:phosphocarrier protein HPr
MPSAEVIIINRLGLHARAAAKFVQIAAKSNADIAVTKGDKKVNGKSIMGLMMLAAAQGAIITISTSGDAADSALQALIDLIANRFGEPE